VQSVDPSIGVVQRALADGGYANADSFDTLEQQGVESVEPVFGIIKAALGFRQFLLRGMEKVHIEWDLVCLAYNVKRLWGSSRA
jgi:hypothetical protein